MACFGAFLMAFWVAHAEGRRRATKAGGPARGFTFFRVVGGGFIVGAFLLVDGVWWGRFSAYSFALFWSLLGASLAFIGSLSVFASPPGTGNEPAARRASVGWMAGGRP